ncbi:MAG: hypothetical protein KDB61_15065, partial [Planctomycetes bacterium]|nr:hypothetical protein [Planctomycetota bacterium]
MGNLGRALGLVALAAAGVLGVGWYSTRTQTDPVDPMPIFRATDETEALVSPEAQNTPSEETPVQSQLNNGPTNLGAQLTEKNRRAIALLEEKQFEEAEALFRECMQAEPTESAFSSNLAEALIRRAIARWDAEPEESLAALIEAIGLV